MTAVPAKRRLDITLERLDEIVQAASPGQIGRWRQEAWWNCAEILSRLRGMEMAESDALGREVADSADAYDRSVSPGEIIPIAILAAFKALMDPRQSSAQ